MRYCLVLTIPLLLATACSRTDNEPGPGGVTVSEAKALDDAAEMLESREDTGTKDSAQAKSVPQKSTPNQAAP